MPLTIYHNPRCSKSRATLALLRESGCEFRVVEYLEQPPDAARILAFAKMLGQPVAALLRQSEPEFRGARNPPDTGDDAALAAWLERHPRALERPLVVDPDRRRAVLGRPPENVLALLG